ncbi:MAG TPA: malonyl-CoA decarboxylase [Geminicoccaceae bacterium]|nr:malonyl-CoA decarboxylase [Geminicoccaceae bacterium]
MAEASSEQLAPAADQTRSAPANDQSTLVGRALSRWSRAIRDIATSTRLPFLGGDDPDLGADQADKLRAEMRACLEARGGEALARAQAAGIASVYLGLSPTGRTRFFGILATEFGVDRAEVDRAIAHYQEAEDEADKLEAERALRRALVSPRMRLLTKFNALPEGTRFLIDMRAHLLALNSEDPHFRALDADFRHLLATWFDIGFLRRARLTWDSPASLLEKIIAYEAVHEIRSWQDLHHRLDGDRRCYAFFHPSLPDEPLIFLQVALVQGLAGRIEPLLDEGSPDVPPERADTAVFYSITNTLYGLRGISFGNFLIKQVVDDLARDLPNLKQFATLSPLPRLRAWLESEPPQAWLSEAQRNALTAAVPQAASPIAALADPGWLQDAELVGALEEPLVRAAARYLTARDADGQPVDPVARFHLGNGARIERINWLADRSPRRLAQSAGLMVNYSYDPPEIEQNHEAFASNQLITVAPAIYDLLKAIGGDATAGVRVSRRASRLGRMIRRP